MSENSIKRAYAQQPATITLRVGFLERDERILPDMGARVAFLADDDHSGTRSSVYSSYGEASRLSAPTESTYSYYNVASAISITALAEVAQCR